MVAREQIEEILRRIVQQFKPDRVILFGSHARGDAGPESDADLLVVMPVSGSRRKQATAIELALVGVNLPVDLIVATPEEAERQRRQKGTVVGAALREGRLLYERSR